MTPERAILEARYWLNRAADPEVFKAIPNTHAFCYQALKDLEAAFPKLLSTPLEISPTTMTKPDFIE